jgi:hypothetical protein
MRPTLIDFAQKTSDGPEWQLARGDDRQPSSAGHAHDPGAMARSFWLEPMRAGMRDVAAKLGGQMAIEHRQELSPGAIPVFTYWEDVGPAVRPVFIDLCLLTMLRNIRPPFQLVRLGPDTVEEWCDIPVKPGDLIPRTLGQSRDLDTRRTAVFTDLLRLRLLATHGGMWLDMDTVVFPRFVEFEPWAKLSEAILMRSGMGTLINGILFAQPGAELFQRAWRLANDQLERTRIVGWTQFGARLLQSAILEDTADRLLILPTRYGCPVNSMSQARFMTHGTDAEVSSDALFCCLYNNRNLLSDLRLGELLEGRRLIASVFRRAFPDMSKEDVASTFWPFRRREAPRRRSHETSARDTFTDIYMNRGWKNRESISGCGSTLRQTAQIRDYLPRVMRELGARSLLDIPCGDFNWMKEVPLAGVEYIGADIVRPLVEENERRFGSSAVRFLCLDLATDNLPPADLVIVRDALVHLSLNQAVDALLHIARSGGGHLLATTFPSVSANEDIVTGDFRKLNLRLPPFNLPEPLTMLDEKHPNPRHADKSLALWRIDMIEPAIRGAGERSS